MLTAGIIGAGGSILGGIFGGNAQKKAAQTQAAAANRAADMAMQQYQTTRGDLMPWITGGADTYKDLLSRLKDGTLGGAYGKQFSAPTADEARSTPGYEFILSQGEKGIKRAQAASGGAFTGGTVKRLEDYNKDLASTTYNDTFLRKLQEFNTNYGVWSADQNRDFGQLSSLSQQGENAAAQAGQFGANATRESNGYTTDAASAIAAGNVGASNSLWSGINGGINNITQLMMANALKPKLSTGTTLPAGQSSYLQNLRNPANYYNIDPNYTNDDYEMFS